MDFRQLRTEPELVFTNDDEIIEYVKPFYGYSNPNKPDMTVECKAFLGSPFISEELKFKLIKVNIHIIEHFAGVSEELKMATVDRCPNILQTMEDSGISVSDEIYNYAYEKHGNYSIHYMRNIPLFLQKRSIDDIGKYYYNLYINRYCRDMKIYAIRKFPALIRELKDYPSDDLDELIDLAIECDPTVIRYWSYGGGLSNERIKRALSLNGLALPHVPNEITDEFIDIAVGQNGEAIKHVPEAMRTDALELKAVKQNPIAIGHIINYTKKPSIDRMRYLKYLKGVTATLYPDIIDRLLAMNTKEVREIANARRAQLLRLKICNVCIGLQGLGLPALVTMYVIDASDLPHYELLTDHDKWEVIRTVKHYI